MLDLAECTGPVRQRELPTVDHIYNIGNRSSVKGLDHELGIDDLSVRGVKIVFDLTAEVSFLTLIVVLIVLHSTET